jgi:Ca2+/H+ antiporter
MDLSSVKRGVTLIFVLLCAILIANWISNVLMSVIGLTGVPEFIAGFVIYAAIFFGVLYLFERFGGIRVFNFFSK